MDHLCKLHLYSLGMDTKCDVKEVDSLNWRRLGFWLLLPFAVSGLLVGLLQVWPQPRAAAYRLYQNQGRWRALVQLTDFQRIESDRFTLYYRHEDADVAPMVLGAAEEVYDVVVTEMGERPGERVPIILYPDRPSLRQAFGWSNGESALGVYWQGTIRLLSPHAWLNEEGADQLSQAYRKLNPIAHELTHYLLDQMTSGNYPHWFTEGLAQRVEYRATGFLWVEASATLDQPLYALGDLKDWFDQLSNQPLAYRQSYLLVEWMANHYGEESLTRLIGLLASGEPFDEAVQQVFDRSMEQIDAEWRNWVEANRERLDPAQGY